MITMMIKVIMMIKLEIVMIKLMIRADAPLWEDIMILQCHYYKIMIMIIKVFMIRIIMIRDDAPVLEEIMLVLQQG